MRASPLNIPDVLLIEPRVFEDDRGFFFESFHQAQFEAAVGASVNFVQDNHSLSRRHVLRGLHYQLGAPQGKLVRVVSGTIFDVAIDLRRNSPHCGQWSGAYLSAVNKRQLWIPEGFAHGFLVLAEHAEVLYKSTRFYAPEYERGIAWDDPQLAIAWPLTEAPIVSPKDARGTLLEHAELFD